MWFECCLFVSFFALLASVQICSWNPSFDWVYLNFLPIAREHSTLIPVVLLAAILFFDWSPSLDNYAWTLNIAFLFCSAAGILP